MGMIINPIPERLDGRDDAGPGSNERIKLKNVNWS